MAADRIARESWWTSQEFATMVHYHHGSPCSHCIPSTTGPLVAVVQRRSLTPINTINQSR
jgi:hypothetical protein